MAFSCRIADRRRWPGPQERKTRNVSQIAPRTSTPRLIQETNMKRNDRNAATATLESETKASVKNNGHSNVAAEPGSADFTAILASLQTMRDGDFSVRLPGSWTGLAGKIADTFNEIVAANQQMAQELKRVGQVVGKEGQNPRAHAVSRSRGARGARWKPRSTRWWRICFAQPRK